MRIWIRRTRQSCVQGIGALVIAIPAAGAIAPAALSTPASAKEAQNYCPRPAAGSVLEEPEDLRSRDGVLKLDLTVRNERQPDGSTRYCYLLDDGNQSPTLRLKPGDLLILSLKNRLSDLDAAAPQTKQSHSNHKPSGARDPCTSSAMTPTSTNLHFHGLSVPPLCHQDDVLKTTIQPGDAPFEYRFRIPDGEPPGLYWYHPHIHGFSSRQVLGGASGALIIEGLERANAEVAGLPERVFVIRDQDLANPNAPPSPSEPAARALIERDGDAANTGIGAGKPAKDLSINFIPVPYPEYPPALVRMKPGERQLWRVLNASSVTYLDIAALYKRGPKYRPQWIGVVAVDGVPLTTSGPAGQATQWRDSVVISPGARVEFIIDAPPAGVPAMLVTRTVNTGQGGENDPNRVLLSIVATPDAAAPQSTLPSSAGPLPPAALPWLGSVTPTRVRKLYFSENLQDPRNPNSAPKFYLTVDGQTPATFDPMSGEPNIVVKQGDVEDWIIENRSTELHAFHIHQVHFQVVDWLGLSVNEPFLRDTVNVPFLTAGMKGYPSVRLRMDFRDPNAIGTFVYHCHLLDHEDGGMMGLIRVEPRDAESASRTSAVSAAPAGVK
jgi:FtsP/CotA-like multicopper oxidase with cupredoxin domain